MTAAPESPEQLLERLFTIFPKYRSEYKGTIHDYEPTFHSVLIGFNSFLGQYAHLAATSELKEFGQLVNTGVASGSDLENAFATCLLEHLRQIKVAGVLRPYLSEEARRLTRRPD
jgi:hypothetical protein